MAKFSRPSPNRLNCGYKSSMKIPTWLAVKLSLFFLITLFFIKVQILFIFIMFINVFFLKNHLFNSAEEILYKSAILTPKLAIASWGLRL